MSFELTWHRAGDELNDKLDIQVTDGQGPSGAHHHYLIKSNTTKPMVDLSVKIKFQRGGVRESGLNGVSMEALLAIVAHRL